MSSSLGPAGIVGGGSECTALSSPSIPPLRCPWARHRTHNCSPGAAALAAHCSGCVCVFTAVCVCTLDSSRAQIHSMGHHTWPYVTSLSLSKTSMCHQEPLVIWFCLYVFWISKTGSHMCSSQCELPKTMVSLKISVCSTEENNSLIYWMAWGWVNAANSKTLFSLQPVSLCVTNVINADCFVIICVFLVIDRHNLIIFLNSVYYKI